MFDTFLYAFNAVTPMLLLMLLGWWMKAIHFFDDSLLKKMNSFTFRFGISCMMFRNIYTLSSLREIHLDSIWFVLVSCLALTGMGVAGACVGAALAAGVSLASGACVAGAALASGVGAASGASVPPAVSPVPGASPAVSPAVSPAASGGGVPSSASAAAGSRQSMSSIVMSFRIEQPSSRNPRTGG